MSVTELTVLYLDELSVALAVQLRPRAPHGWTFATVQDGEMDASPVSCSATQSFQSIHLLHQLTLPHSTQRRVTGQGPWESETKGSQSNYTMRQI